jgi:hypothetical protein
VARTARTTVGQASSSWSARCSRIVLSYRMIAPMTAAMSAARHHIATSPALPAAARPASVIDVFVATLGTHRDRAILLAMLLCGLRSAEVRGLPLADRYGSAAAAGDRQRRQGKARTSGDPAFFTEVSAYLRWERPGCLEHMASTAPSKRTRSSWS